MDNRRYSILPERTRKSIFENEPPFFGKVEEVCKIFLWEINNFQTLADKQIIKSPSIYPDAGFRYELILRPTVKDDETYMSLSIEKAGAMNLAFSFKVSVLKNKTEKFNTNYLLNEKCDLFVSKQSILDPNTGILVDDTLIIQVEMIKCMSNLKSAALDFQPSNFNEESFYDYYKNEKLSDVIVKVQEQKIPAHKILLAKKSKVFAAMFENDMEESEKNLVEIVDIEYEVVEQMLQFMYKANFEIKNKEMAMQLLIASDKYDIKMLFKQCQDYFSSIFSNDNVIEYLDLAHTYNADNLRKKAFQYIVKHSKTLSIKQEFKTHLSKLPQDLIVEIVCSLAGNKSKYEL